MIKLSYRKFWILPIKEYYFWYKEGKIWFLDNIFINQVEPEINLIWFKKSIFNTWIISLLQDEEAIFRRFSDTTRNEINRAQKEWIQYWHTIKPGIHELKEYHKFYNQFLKAKWLRTTSLSDIMKYKGHLFLTYSLLDNERLNYHLYITDQSTEKVRLLQSCSLFRNESDKNKINVIGYANRWLHYHDIKLFKDLWYKEYDRGWLYLWEDDKQKVNIDKFKLSFGPETKIQYNYERISPCINIFYKLSKNIWKIIKKKNK